MKNNINMRRMAAAMAVVVATGAAGTCGYQRSAITAKAADVDTKELQKVAENALPIDKKAEETNETTKEESVYVKADVAGNVKNTTVTEWIKNPGTGKVEDISSLKEIKNIKGDEKWTENGNSSLSWDADGDDIYYQGTTDQKLPVGVKISYKLNGKDISAEDLQGKDGKVEIHVEYSNNSSQSVDVNGKQEAMFIPFTMITAMMLPTDQYQNVQIDNGKVISDAERQIVIGLGFPGLNDNLKLENSDIELPESLTITADVKKAAVQPSITMASTDFLQDLDLDKIDSFDDLGGSMAKLKDATNQLVDGSKKAADGAQKLADGAGKLSDGAGTLSNGTKSLADGAGTLANGTKTLKDGTSALTTKVPELVEGVAALDAGAKQLNGGLGNLKSGIDGDLTAGAQNLQGGIAKYTGGVSQVQAGMNGDGTEANPGLVKGAKGLAAGADQVTAGASQLATGASQVATGAKGVSDGAGRVSEGVKSVSNSLTGLKTVTAQTSAGAAALRAAIDQIQAYATKDISVNKTLGQTSGAEAIQATLSGYGLTQEQINAVLGIQTTTTVTAAEINANARITLMGKEQVTAAAAGVEQGAAGVDTAVGQLQGAMTGDGTAQNPGLVAAASSLAAGAKTVSTGADSVSTGAGSVSAGASSVSAGAKSVSDGASQLQAGVNSLADSNAVLNGGATALVDGMKQVATGAAQLAAGAGQLQTGTGALAAGTGALADGAMALGDGVNKLDQGASALKAGADKLNTGAGTLADGTVTLADGANALADGNVQLADGMAQYKAEAIDQLIGLFDGDLTKVADRMKAIVNAGKDYKSFAGIQSEMSGTTKFIIETEGISE